MNEMRLSIADVQKLTGIGRTMIYSLINSERLSAKKLNTKTVILKSDLEDFLESLDEYPSKSGGENE